MAIYTDNWSDHIRQFKHFFQIMREAKLTKKFLKYQKNYSVVEKETLGLVSALDYFDVYLGSTPFKIKVYTDHNPLTFLKTMKNKNQKLVRWSLPLQEYNLEIQHIPGSENVVAGALSRSIG